MGLEQRALWERMIRATEEDLVGHKIPEELPVSLPDYLEVLFRRSKVQDRALAGEFSALWQAIEIRYSLESAGLSDNMEARRREVEAMRDFLLRTLPNVEAYAPEPRQAQIIGILLRAWRAIGRWIHGQ